MLKHANTYEIMLPEDVGVLRTELVLGKHSGRHALSQRIRDLGYHLDAQQLQKVFEDFKGLADRKKTIYDADVEALAESVLNTGPAVWTLEAVSCNGGSATVPCAAVVLWHKDGTIHRDAGTGDGPIDAVFKTIERILQRLRETTAVLDHQRHPGRRRSGGSPDRSRIPRPYPARPGGEYGYH